MVRTSFNNGLNKLTIQTMELINKDNITLNILNIFVQIDIKEDLLNNFVTGSVVVNDESDLHVTLPVIGNEKLRVRWQSSNNSTVRDFTFVITELEYINEEQEGLIKQFKLNFIDERYLRMISKPYYNFYAEASLSTIVSDITKQFKIDVTIDVESKITNETINYNNLHGSSIKALRDLRYKFSLPLVLYQKNNDLILTTYDKLFKQTPIPCNLEIQVEDLNTSGRLQANNLTKFTIQDTFDIIDSNLNGIEGYNNFLFDPFEDTFSIVEYKLSDYTQNTKAKYHVTSENFMNIRLNKDSSYIESYLLQDFIETTMPYGNSDMKVGDMISVVLRSNNEKSNISAYSGNFLIVSLTHTIFRNSYEYKQQYNLIKKEMFRNII